MANLPHWMEIVFILITIATIFFFHLSNGKPKYMTLLIVVWSLIHATLAYTNFYQVVDTFPPRFALIMLPVIVTFIYAFLPGQIDWATKRRNIQFSTVLHTIRIPVEIILFYLFIHKMVPELMTFEGRNFDILIGLSAPIISIMIYKNKISNKGLLIWNIAGLIFIDFIFLNGLLSAELPIQQFGFEQPNKAVTFFPFVLLPATIVPIVIYTHLIDIVKLKRTI